MPTLTQNIKTFVKESLKGFYDRIELRSISYSDLKSLKESNSLVPGAHYRITDYQCTTTQSDTSSANHQFDVIVEAMSYNTLSEDARAIIHDGDTYFSDCNLESWELKYCIDNDTNKYAWADSTNGKGVIYRMIDEWGNDCPYDFKNILFKRDLADFSSDISNSEDVWMYTFSCFDDGITSGATIVDESIVAKDHIISDEDGIFGNNVIKELHNLDVLKLNDIVFYTDWSNEVIYHYSNTFGNNCWNNTFGSNCNSNTFGSDCQYNTFGNYCYSNTFGYGCYYNTFGDDCYYNTFGDNCNHIVFGNSNNQNGDYVRYVIVENGNEYIRLYKDGTADSSHYLQNIYIAQGFNNTDTYKEISTIDRALTYRTTVAQLSNGTTRIYKEDEDDRNVQADWNQTDTTADDYILNKPDLDAVLYVETTYSALKGMVDGGTLIEGQMYRITDYNTTTVQENTSAAGHQFDLVVTAISNSELDHRASAVLHEGDTYFSTAGADLSKWQIWYDIENDSTKYAWADSGSSGGAKSGESTVPEWITSDSNVSEILSKAGLSSVLVYQGIVEFDKVDCYSYGTAEQANAVSKNCVTFVIPKGKIPSTDEKVPVVDSSMVAQTDVPCSTISKTTVPVSGIREVPEYIVPIKEIYKILYSAGLSTELPYNGTVSYMGNTCFSYGTPEQISVINDKVKCTAVIVQDGMIPIQDLQILVLDSTGKVSLTDTIGSVSPKSIVVGGGGPTGVIYRMIDEWGNDCPYDFKNILFTVSGQTASAYTFNVYSDSTCSDHSLNGQYCYDNTMGLYLNSSIQQTLNFNVFYNTSATTQCSENTFGDLCFNNTFGDNCFVNTFGDGCFQNTFGNYCQQNTFGNFFYSNTFGDSCQLNTFGNGCLANTFGNRCSNNTLGNACYSNIFGDRFQYNIFGNGCISNTFGNYCLTNTFGNSCSHIVFGDSSNQYGAFVRYVVVENGNQYIRLYKDGTADDSHYLQNIYIAQGFNNTTTYKEISTIDRALTYRTTVAQLSDGTTRIYKEDEDDRNVQVDWNESDSGSSSYILNKPFIPTELSDLSNVSISAATEGEVLVYDSNNDNWINKEISGGTRVVIKNWTNS